REGFESTCEMASRIAERLGMPRTSCSGRRYSEWNAKSASKAHGDTGGVWAQYLVEQGTAVYEVNARWTAIGRRSARKPDKTDRQDAHAVALFLHREAANLTELIAEDETAILDLLATERESAIAEATRLRNQIHALLLQLDPEY